MNLKKKFDDYKFVLFFQTITEIHFLLLFFFKAENSTYKNRFTNVNDDKIGSRSTSALNGHMIPSSVAGKISFMT